jgi:hypothetical protein
VVLAAAGTRAGKPIQITLPGVNYVGERIKALLAMDMRRLNPC